MAGWRSCPGQCGAGCDRVGSAVFLLWGIFGRGPIAGCRGSGLSLPCLLLNYFGGQGAMIIGLPADQAAQAIQNPFFFLASDEWRLPLVLLATVATSSPARPVISGAFSITHQAVQMGLYVPAPQHPPHSRKPKGTDLHPGQSTGH